MSAPAGNVGHLEPQFCASKTDPRGHPWSLIEIHISHGGGVARSCLNLVCQASLTPPPPVDGGLEEGEVEGMEGGAGGGTGLLFKIKNTFFK